LPSGADQPRLRVCDSPDIDAQPASAGIVIASTTVNRIITVPPSVAVQLTGTPLEARRLESMLPAG
jgi:hypothetical protein